MYTDEDCGRCRNRDFERKHTRFLDQLGVDETDRALSSGGNSTVPETAAYIRLIVGRETWQPHCCDGSYFGIMNDGATDSLGYQILLKAR